MLFGSCVNAGVIGNNPEIGANVDEDEGVAMQYDFKSIYGSVLMDWFEVSEEKVKELLTEDFQYLPIISSCSATSTRDVAVQLNMQAFPNPFVHSFKLQLNLSQNTSLKIDLFDVVGKRVKNLVNQNFNSGEHSLDIDAHDLATGVYFARIQAGSTVKTVRVVKR